MLRMEAQGVIDAASPIPILSLINRLNEQGKERVLRHPHSGNWEWFGKSIPDLSGHNCLAVYKKVKSPAFERLMMYLRTKDCALEMVESNSVP